MVDAEKAEQTGMTEETTSVQSSKGGDRGIRFANGAEYSDDEFQKFSDLYGRTMKDIDEGQIVTGRVLAIVNQEVVVDIGFKSEGTIPLEEFGMPPEVKVGDKVEVFLDSIENQDGQLILSKKKADFVQVWDRVIQIHDQGSTIKGRCMRRIKGGIVVDLMGVDAFLPGSQIDVKPIRDFDALIGQTFDFKIVKVNKMRKNIVVSRRSLLEESMAEQRKQILAELEKGQVREGGVKNITDFGVFVDLGGVDGLLHINDLSWGRINHPSEVVKLDERIKVVVLDFNEQKDRISLGMKQLQPHPWENIDKKYPEGSLIKGKVVSIADYGAFVELEKGVEGLIHVSEMSWTRNVVHPSKLLNVGDMLDVKVLSLEKDRKRISLGIKQLTQDPWEHILAKYPVGSRHKGRVRNMTNFGVFVEMEDGIDGLIHISDLSWTKKLKHPSEMMKKGQDVEIVVLDVNKDERRLSLGYKQLTDDPWAEFETAYKVGVVTQAKVLRLIEKGMVVELPLGLEGFVPISQLPESSMAKVAQNMKDGDAVELVVIEFDKENKRVVLSRKKMLEMEKGKQTEAEQSDVAAYTKPAEAPTMAEMAGEGLQEKKAEKEEKKKPAKKASAKKAKDDAAPGGATESGPEAQPAPPDPQAPPASPTEGKAESGEAPAPEGKETPES
jgi:small subunit ribosomal protein S1